MKATLVTPGFSDYQPLLTLVNNVLLATEVQLSARQEDYFRRHAAHCLRKVSQWL